MNAAFDIITLPIRLVYAIIVYIWYMMSGEHKRVQADIERLKREKEKLENDLIEMQRIRNDIY